MPINLSPTKQKILLLLMGGLAFQGAYTPRKQIRLLKSLAKEWKKINEKKLKDEIRALYRAKLVSLKECVNDTFEMVLTDKGKIKAIKFSFNKKITNPGSWDKKWRIVIFDIPEKLKLEML